jgi:CheY-like chemotaxis protein
VEDNPANMDLMRQIFVRHLKIRLLTAGNGLTGIELARTALPNVTLLDINLPGISGFEIRKLLREDLLTAHIRTATSTPSSSRLGVLDALDVAVDATLKEEFLWPKATAQQLIAAYAC